MSPIEFLPQDKDKLVKKKAYLKLQDGDNRIRIMARPIAGWIDWHVIDGKRMPVRTRPDNYTIPFDAAQPVKAFWAMIVWNYATEKLNILEVTQGSIIKAITALAADPDWGNYFEYDIKISKKGTALDTEYTVTPIPRKPIPEAAISALNADKINLDALYDGLDPWDQSIAKKAPQNASEKISAGQLMQIEQMLLVDPDARKKIHEAFKIEDVALLKPADFDRAIKALTNRKEAINGKPKVA